MVLGWRSRVGCDSRRSPRLELRHSAHRTPVMRSFASVSRSPSVPFAQSAPRRITRSRSIPPRPPRRTPRSSNSIATSPARVDGAVTFSVTKQCEYPTNDQLHETLEITHGFSTSSKSAMYFFTSAAPGQGRQYVGSHIRPRIRAPEEWDLPVGLSLSTEFGFVKDGYDEGPVEHGVPSDHRQKNGRVLLGGESDGRLVVQGPGGGNEESRGRRSVRM